MDRREVGPFPAVFVAIKTKTQSFPRPNLNLTSLKTLSQQNKLNRKSFNRSRFAETYIANVYFGNWFTLEPCWRDENHPCKT